MSSPLFSPPGAETSIETLYVMAFAVVHPMVNLKLPPYPWG
jgi:hypothetical protein